VDKKEEWLWDLDGTTLTMVFKLALEAKRTWKRIKGYEFIPLVLENKKFVEGDLEEAA